MNLYIINKETGEKVDMVEHELFIHGEMLYKVTEHKYHEGTSWHTTVRFEDVSDKYEIRIESDVRSKEEIEDKIIELRNRSSYESMEDNIEANGKVSALQWALNKGW